MTIFVSDVKSMDNKSGWTKRFPLARAKAAN